MANEDDVWLEVALNGAVGRQFQPKIPVTPDDIIKDGVACAKAGAAIIHLHAYNANAEPVEDADIYSQIIEGIRDECDAIVYPTLALHGNLEERYAPIKTLMERGLLECGVVDPGSVNIVHRMQIFSGQDGFIYPNPTDHIREGLVLAAQGGWRPAYAIYEPGFARLGAALADTVENLKTPIYRLMFSDNLLFGMPPTLHGLAFYERFLSELVPNAPWMLSGLDADVMHLIEPAVSLGAHIRVGLEDAPFGSETTNVEYVEKAVQLIESSGRKVATPAAIRMSD
ncbi:MAG: 3-keto-5-aminohexanoate cleavage protein [Pseudomonadota bacterium]